MFWLWSEYGLKKVPQRTPYAERPAGERPRVNIIGPSYGTFNTPSDLAEIRRLVQGIGAEIKLWCSRSAATLADVSRLVEADVNICMYREFGRIAVRGARAALPAGADRPAQHDQVPAQARRTAGPGPGTLHRAREKHSTIKPTLGPVALRSRQDFF